MRLLVFFQYPLTGNHWDGEPKTSKPDTDNAVKALKDAMTKVKFWKDDAQVADEHIIKIWAKVPGIHVQVTDWGEWV